MPIPAFDQNGLLPIGVWDCTLDEIKSVFAWNEPRQRQFANLQRFLETEWYPLREQCPIYVDGSYVRCKQEPQDIDVVLDITDIENTQALIAALNLRVRHDEIKSQYEVDIWVRHPMIPNNLVDFFQYLGTKAAADLRMDSKQRKGILRLP